MAEAQALQARRCETAKRAGSGNLGPTVCIQHFQVPVICNVWQGLTGLIRTLSQGFCGMCFLCVLEAQAATAE